MGKRKPITIDSLKPGRQSERYENGSFKHGRDSCHRCGAYQENPIGIKICSTCAGDWLCEGKWQERRKRGIDVVCNECGMEKPKTKLCPYCRNHEPTRIPQDYDCCNFCRGIALEDKNLGATVTSLKVYDPMGTEHFWIPAGIIKKLSPYNQDLRDFLDKFNILFTSNGGCQLVITHTTQVNRKDFELAHGNKFLGYIHKLENPYDKYDFHPIEIVLNYQLDEEEEGVERQPQHYSFFEKESDFLKIQGYERLGKYYDQKYNELDWIIDKKFIIDAETIKAKNKEFYQEYLELENKFPIQHQGGGLFGTDDGW